MTRSSTAPKLSKSEECNKKLAEYLGRAWDLNVELTSVCISNWIMAFFLPRGSVGLTTIEDPNINHITNVAHSPDLPMSTTTTLITNVAYHHLCPCHRPTLHIGF